MKNELIFQALSVALMLFLFAGITMATDSGLGEEYPVPITKADWITAEMFAATVGEAQWKRSPGVHVHGGDHLPVGPNVPLPIFRKSFILENTAISSARVAICGLGHFELSVNGAKVGDHFLDPPWSDYADTCYYVRFDVAEFLKSGENVLGVMLGNGMYNVRGGRYTKFIGSFGPPKLTLYLVVSQGDKEQIITSNDTWKTDAGPIAFSCIYGGEDYDGRKEQPGWDKPGFDDGHWKPVKVVNGPGGKLCPATSPPIRVVRHLGPASITKLKDGRYEIDLGENLSARPVIKVKGKAGSRVTIETAERKGKPWKGHSYAYTLRGDAEPEVFAPRFTYFGFQYLYVNGVAWGDDTDSAHGLPELIDVGADFVSSCGPRIGTFACSNPLFNEIDKMIDRSVASNLQHVLTDCPHREKLGWLEVAHLMGPSILLHYDMGELYRKICRDTTDSQLENGLVPDIAPEYVRFKGGFFESPEWGSASVQLPWLIYRWYGDERILREQYSTMARYTDYLAGTRNEVGLVKGGLGDWYDWTPEKGHVGNSQLTPKELPATCMLYDNARILRQTAARQRKRAEARKWKNLMEEVRRDFLAAYYDKKNKTVATGSQCALALGLYFGLVPDQDRDAVLAKLVRHLEKNQYRPSTGEVSFRYLVLSLAQAGRSDVVYRIINRTDPPGYGCMLKQHGLQTLSERWDRPGSSLNHCMFGHIQEWFQKYVLGIRQAPGSTGYEKVLIDPFIPDDLDWAKGSFESPNGRIEVAWARKGTAVEVTIKAEHAEVIVPPGRKDIQWKVKENSVKEQGHNLWSGWLHSQNLVDFVIANARADKASQSTDVLATDLRCEYLTDPLGVDAQLPRFSWKLVDSNKTRGQKQTAYQIVVKADSPDGTKTKIDLWDSGKVNSPTSVNNVYAGPALTSDQNCYWKVRVWDKDGNVTGWSPEARFSMGLLQLSDWQGDWIRYKEADNIKHIWYRKNFSLKNAPSLAFVHLCSIGYHELYVNGQRIGTRVLSPGVTNLEKRALYVTYDITSKLKNGDNVIAVWTGPGWARSDGSYGKGVWKQDSIFKCQVNMSNGMSLHSDASWKCKISSSENKGLWKGGGRGEYGGEIIDARRHIDDWNTSSYDDTKWANASTYTKSLILSAEMMEPDRKVETLTPVKMTAGDGFYTFDMGRNFTGWLEMKLRNGKAGETVKFMTANDPGLKVQFKQESHYIHDASGRGTFSHRFNYMAGRWITIEGLSYKPKLEDLKCYIVTNDRKRTGSFVCSKKLFNDIYETDLKTYIANTVNGVVMDCPHRERFGYGEIALACTWGCGIPNYESAPFYAKNTRDWYDVQREDGFVNTIAPQVYKGAGGTLWSSAPVTLTWEFYKAYGDKRKLEEGYLPMKKWLDYLNNYISDDGVLTAYAKVSRFLGDWATPHGSEYGNIPAAKLFNNCVYAYNLNVFVQTAKILGKLQVAATYSKRLAELRKNAHKHFFNEDTKTYIDGRQLSMAFPLYTGITPDHERKAVFANFVDEITNKKPYLDTGSPGLPILLKYIIEDVERVDLLYHCLARTEQPGYGYFLTQGQTTWPEYWQIEGHASKIHTCYTSIAGYFTKGIGGIRPNPANYGMKNFIIKPNLVGDLTYANTTSGSYYGPMVSNWYRSANNGKFHIEVPPNTMAKVYIPAKNVNDVLEAGQPAAKAKGVTYLEKDGIYAVFLVDSGEYRFSSSSVPPAN